MEDKNIYGQDLVRHQIPPKLPAKPMYKRLKKNPKPVATWKPTKETELSRRSLLTRGETSSGKPYRHKPSTLRTTREDAAYVPPPVIKPSVKISKKQMQRFMARDFEKRQAGYRNLMDQAQPKQKESMTRLFQNEQVIDGTRVRDYEMMPYGQGYRDYVMSQKGMLYDQPPGVEGRKQIKYQFDPYDQPAANVLSPGAEQPFRQEKIRSIGPQVKRMAMDARVVEEEAKLAKETANKTQASVDALSKRLGKYTSDKLVESLPTSDLAQYGQRVDEIWKAIGGKSVTGRWWGKMRRTTRGRYKPKTAQSHFTRVFLRWLVDPDSAAKLYPNEIKDPNFGVEVLWKEFVGNG